MTGVRMVLYRSLGLAALLLTLGGAPALAQQPPGSRPTPPAPGGGPAAQPRVQENPAGRAHLDLTVVYANHSGQVDPRVARLKAQFSSLGFTGFQVLSTHDAQLAAGQDTSINVESGQKIEVTLVSRTESNVKVRIQLERNGQKVVDTTATFPPDRAFTVAVGNYQDGKLLVLIKAD